MSSNEVAQLNSTVKDLKRKIEMLEQEQSDILRYFELAIVDTRDDMKITNSYGVVDTIFEGVKSFERGDNLIKIIYKSTKNNKEKPEGDVATIEEQEYIEDSVAKFIDGTREERIFKIIGEKDDGEVFLLVWLMRRHNEKYFKSYFKIVPTNAIIRSMQEKHGKELEDAHREMAEVFDLVTEGISILDLKSKIVYMNERAKKSFIDNQKLANAPVEGRYFSQIFVTEPADEVKKRQELVYEVIDTKAVSTYTKKRKDAEYEYVLKPILTANNNVKGVLIISKLATPEFDQPMIANAPQQPLDNNKLIMAIKTVTAENKALQQKAKDLELQNKAFAKRRAEDKKTIEQLYALFDKG